ncbi:hypothetical protein AVEN_249012-1 [Araneus ventricosus]|uniref:Uncharacterized protein n=1 Tax=Araneus ventricosus TaxID=182803 RepID=A0A4Y2T216_ARAVE|nr:hypothetical protein AVEN_249012-1 [Araneus ventricosus]
MTLILVDACIYNLRFTFMITHDHSESTTRPPAETNSVSVHHLVFKRNCFLSSSLHTLEDGGDYVEVGSMTNFVSINGRVFWLFTHIKTFICLYVGLPLKIR